MNKIECIMTLNNFDPKTREFTVISEAQENPRSKGQYFEQTYATFDSLPELSANEVAVRNADNTAWKTEIDFRGDAWHTDTKDLVKIVDLGALSEALTKIKPGEFDHWDGSQWIKNVVEELKAEQEKSMISINRIASEARRAIAGDADHYQTSGWTEKARRAERITSGTQSADDIQIVEREVQRRGKGETVAELVAIHLIKAKRYAFAISDVDGMMSAAKREILSTTTVEELQQLLPVLKQQASEELEIVLNS